MILAFNHEKPFTSPDHAGQAVADKVGLGVLVAVAHDVVDCEGVGRHESAAADEAAVDKGRTVHGCPAIDKIGALLFVHLAQVSHEEGRRRRPSHDPERGEGLTDEEDEEGM